MVVCGVWLVYWGLGCGWRRTGGYVHVVAGTLGGGGAESSLCVSACWHIGNWCIGRGGQSTRPISFHQHVTQRVQLDVAC